MKIFSRKKRAALDLSLTTIVILIFAITVLGLGLVLIRGLFNKAEGEIDKAFNQGQLKVPPTASEPFTISKTRVTLNRGDKDELQVAVYNTGTALHTFKLETLGDCIEQVDANGNPYFLLTPSNQQLESLERSVKAQEIGSWGLTVRIARNTPSGDYACSIQTTTSDVADTESDEYKIYYQDFFVEVK
jgi:hypothetical protein